MHDFCKLNWAKPRALVMLLAIAFADPANGDEPALRRPSIVLIFADDLGWKDVGYQGTDFYETPHIDRLARDGALFTAGYAAAGNCAPSRACMLSGQYTPRHGVYAVQSTKRGPVDLMRMEPVPNSQSLARNNVTVAEALKAAGYATGCFGKWHLGSAAEGTGPGDQGFDVVMDKNGRGKISADPKGAFTIARAACDFIEANRARPFFAYIPHHAIHGPLEARQASLDKFKAKPAGKQHRDPLYAASLYDLDHAVGMVLAKLDELKLTDNTLVVFTSDNGGTKPSSQEPLRGAKGCYYEGGIREPFLIRWPAVVKPGTKIDVPVINLDLYPTFLAAASADVPQGKTLDGESLLPLLRGSGKLAREAIFWHFPGYLDNPVPRGRDKVFRTRPVSVIRRGDWKLLLYHEEWLLDGGRDKLATNNAVELYNIAADIGERKDLALDETAQRDALLDELLSFCDRTHARFPTPLNTRKPRRIP